MHRARTIAHDFIRRPLGLPMLVAALALPGCEAADDPTVPGIASPLAPADDTSPAATAQPDASPTAEPTQATSSPTGDTPTGPHGRRDLLVAPQQPVTTAPDSGAEVSLAGRLGGADGGLPGVIGFGWTPCEEVDAVTSGPLTFPDVDGDGHADRMGRSDAGSARLDTVNGEPYENVDDAWPTALHTRDGTPALELVMRAAEPDCATVVLFLDDDGDEEFDLADDGTPTEDYGVTELAWSP
jgi:hypothetical protein